MFPKPLVLRHLWGTCTSLGCSLLDPEKLAHVCGLGEELRGFSFFASQGDPNITVVSSQIRLCRQLPCCLSLILASLAAVTDLQPGLRDISIKEGCMQPGEFVLMLLYPHQLFKCLILQHLEGKYSQEKYIPGSLHIWGVFCKLQ